jgi:hypothetical protein
MNLTFGHFAAPDSPVETRKLRQTIVNLFELEPKLLQQETIGYLSNSSAMLGTAKENGITLLLLGACHHPLPGWNNKSHPIDRTEKVAKHLIQQYQKQDLRFLDGVFGHFALVLIDENKNRKILASDPQNMRSFYYSYTNLGLFFSSNLLTLGKALNEKTSIDRRFESFLLTYAFLPADNTFYSGIKKMPGGNILEWKNNNITWHSVIASNPWEKNYGQIDWNDVTEKKAIDLLYDATMTAHEEMSTSNKDIGVLLGGVDSALIASIFHRLGKNVETYSYSYQDKSFNQPHTDTLSNYLNIKHNWIPITHDVISQGLSNYSKWYNRPTNWANYPIQSTHVVNEMRSNGIQYCYSGDGCDGVFLGYPRTHMMASLMQSARFIPKPAFNILIKALSLGIFERSMGRPYRVLIHILRNLGRAHPTKGFLNFGVLDKSSINRLRAEPSPDAEIDIEIILAELTKGLEHLSPDRLAYQGKSTIAVNSTKIVGSEDVSGIPIFAPYMHPGYATFAKSIPLELLRPKNSKETAYIGKYIFLRMIEEKKLLPREVIYQPTISAVEAPGDDWYFGVLSGQITEMLKQLPFKTNHKFLTNLMRKKWLENMYSNHISSDHITSHEISLLATYASFTKLD